MKKSLTFLVLIALIAISFPSCVTRNANGTLCLGRGPKNYGGGGCGVWAPRIFRRR